MHELEDVAPPLPLHGFASSKKVLATFLPLCHRISPRRSFYQLRLRPFRLVCQHLPGLLRSWRRPPLRPALPRPILVLVPLLLPVRSRPPMRIRPCGHPCAHPSTAATISSISTLLTPAHSAMSMCSNASDGMAGTVRHARRRIGRGSVTRSIFRGMFPQRTSLPISTPGCRTRQRSWGDSHNHEPILPSDVPVGRQ